MLEQRAKWAAHGQPGQQGAITGSVTGFDGQPVAGACVTAVSGGRALTTTAAPDGTFRLAGLAAGSYALEYRGCAATGRYLTTWSGGAATLSNAVRVPVAAGQVRHVPAVMLRPANPAAAIAASQASFRRALAASNRSLSAAAAARTGQISGKVTGKGKPLGGICLLVTEVVGPQSYSAQTAKDGTYTVRGVAPGRYDVIFDPLGACPSSANWLQQTYKDDNSAYGGRMTAVRIKAGHKTSGINADLRLGGELSGTVTGKSHAKLRGICVFASANVGHGQFVNYQGQTAANGSYHLHALFPGKYSPYFEIGCGSHGANYAPAAHHAVRIGLGQNLTVNEKLAAGASITGTVTLKTSSGRPLRGICVYASNASGSVSDDTSTNSNGDYRAIGLTAGRFQLQFSPGCNNNGNYTSATLTAHTTAGRQTSNVDAVLQVGATVSGTITDRASNPVSGICIEVAGNNSDSANVGLDNDGNYVINQLSAGTYQVGFTSGCGNSGSYAPNWYNNQPSQNTATPITLATGETDDEADAVLQPGVAIAGKVTNTAGHAVSGVCVSATTPAGAAFGPVNESQTGRKGTYTIPDLAPGQYLVNFGCGLEQRYANTWFPGAPDAASAEVVSAPAGRTSGINAVLPLGGNISGTVTGDAGHRLSGVCVFAVDTADTSGLPVTSVLIAGIGGSGPGITGSRGTYGISGLPAGRYQVSFEPCTGSRRYADQWFRDKTAAQAATPVKVRAGMTTSGINDRLVIGGTISGRVVNAGGKPLRNICIVATAGSVGAFGAAATGKAGTYTVPGLASGRYAVEFSPCGSQNLITVVTHVRVTAPHTKTGVNATMRPGGSIAGTVKASSGQPVSEACVEIYSRNSAAAAGFGITGLDGTYLATGLAAGTYQVHFGDPQCVLAAPGLAPQWYHNESTQGSATIVPVTVGATTPSIDATLQPDGQITGTVSGPTASPLAGICVTAVPQASGSLPVVAVTGRTGGYTLADLLPGDYKVRFSSGCAATGYATQWYNGAPSQTAATPIPVGAGQTQSGINATLSKSS
jgi:protocatechuate 3,4-dioxygenase beta subunit